MHSLTIYVAVTLIACCLGNHEVSIPKFAKINEISACRPEAEYEILEKDYPKLPKLLSISDEVVDSPFKSLEAYDDFLDCLDDKGVDCKYSDMGLLVESLMELDNNGECVPCEGQMKKMIACRFNTIKRRVLTMQDNCTSEVFLRALNSNLGTATLHTLNIE